MQSCTEEVHRESKIIIITVYTEVHHTSETKLGRGPLQIPDILSVGSVVPVNEREYRRIRSCVEQVWIFYFNFNLVINF